MELGYGISIFEGKDSLLREEINWEFGWYCAKLRRRAAGGREDGGVVGNVEGPTRGGGCGNDWRARVVKVILGGIGKSSRSG
jgi:hypothetical protein